MASGGIAAVDDDEPIQILFEEERFMLEVATSEAHL